MSFTTFLHHLRRRSGTTGRARRPGLPQAGPRRAFQPRLEGLEGRTLLSSVPIVVNSQADSGAGTLRAAITTADGDSSHDYLIDFDVRGAIDLTSALPELDGNVAIQGPGAGSLAVRRATGTPFGIFRIGTGWMVSISDLTIANGYNFNGGGIENLGGTLTVTNCTIANNSADSFGGGFSSDGPATVTNCTFANNSAKFGGGIGNGDGTLTVTNCTFANDSAGIKGGGVYNDATATVTNCTLINNSALDSGGGIYNDDAGTATVTNCTIANNSAFIGGGIENAGTATLTNCAIANNSASGGSLFGGAGIYNDNNGELTVTNSTLTNNSTRAFGGGIENFGTATVTNCTIADNSALDGGGGIFNDGTATVTNCTIANNSGFGGGGGIRSSGSGLTANNTIVAANQSSAGPDVAGALDPSSSYNLIGDGSLMTGIDDGTQGNQVGTAASPIDPLLGPLQDNGGATPTMALLPGSPAIDAGSNALAVDAGNSPLTTDQRGVARVVNGTADVGAFESRIFTITLTGGYRQGTTVNTAFLNPLMVTVTSAYGDPVQGGVVMFAAPPGGAGATFPAGGGGTTTATIDPVGRAAVAVTANTVAGGYAVLASARGASFAAGFSLTNTPDVARTFVVSGYPSPTTAGAVQTVVVTARDQYGNTATGYAGVVHFSSSDRQAVLPPDALLTNGVGLFSVALKTAGTQNVTATDAAFASLTGTQTGITVNPSVATALVIVVPGTVTTGVAFSFTVTAVDAYGNVATGYNGTVHFSSSDKKADLPGNATLTNGTGTFTATFKTKGSQTLTVTDVAFPGLSDSLAILVQQLKK
jgi:hypothetical protein